MLFRSVAQKILEWFKAGTKPLLLTGARQVGKTFIVRQTIQPHCRKLHVFNFEKTPSLAKIFDNELEPVHLIKNLALATAESIDIHQDIIFFDEIQACERALTSLKYFNENLPQAKVIATGSYIGLMQGFPVGKVTTLEMFPMTFEEFLFAVLGDGPVMDAFRNMEESPTLFDKIWPILLEYFYVGGLPEVVTIWVQKRLQNPVDGAAEVKEIQRQLISNYALDFGKYSGRNAPHILGVFQSIPNQLAQNIDDSVKKYKFKDVLPKKKSYSELEGPILWLEQMRMLHRSFIVSEPTLPIISHNSTFKAFAFDMGILSRQLDVSLVQYMQTNFSYKGYLAENFVALELKSSGIDKAYSWQSSGDAEIEFLIPSSGAVAIPLEVKSGKNTRSKSLATYHSRYTPDCVLKLIGSPGGRHNHIVSLPLYYAGKIQECLNNTAFYKRTKSVHGQI